MRRIGGLLLFLFWPMLTCSLVGCRQGSTPSGASEQQQRTRAFPKPQIPTVYTTAPERQAYMLEHFWDGFLKPGYDSDSTVVCGVPEKELESAVGLYATILGSADMEVSRKSLIGLVRQLEVFSGKAGADVDARVDSPEAGPGNAAAFSDSPEAGSGNPASCPDTHSDSTAAFAAARIIELIDRYLYDPNSPVRDEDVYQPFAEALSRSAIVPAARRGAYAFDARKCLLNQRGTLADDFVFKDINGRTHTLYGVKAEMTILFFSNPGCHACRDITDALMARSYVVDMIEKGELAVVNVYIDEETDKWLEYQKEYPKSWHSGYDPTFSIRNDLKYHIRAIPSLYLLDKDKRVMLKDAPQEKVLQLLDNLAAERTGSRGRA